MFGPSQNELLLLLHLPLLISVGVALFMLFSWRTFTALIAALFLSGFWVAIAIASLGSIVGAFMLMASAWATLTFISLMFYVSWRSASTESPERRYADESFVIRLSVEHSNRPASSQSVETAKVDSLASQQELTVEQALLRLQDLDFSIRQKAPAIWEVEALNGVIYYLRSTSALAEFAANRGSRGDA